MTVKSYIFPGFTQGHAWNFVSCVGLTDNCTFKIWFVGTRIIIWPCVISVQCVHFLFIKKCFGGIQKLFSEQKTVRQEPLYQLQMVNSAPILQCYR